MPAAVAVRSAAGRAGNAGAAGNAAKAGNAGHRGSGADELIWAQAMAARIASQRITGPALQLLLDSVDRACGLPARPGWELKAAAHAEIFRLLADVAGDRVAADRQAGLIGDLMRAVGPAANGMIASSRRRLLARLRAGDADGAALEMENHLRALHYMWRLARR
jgi:DNA-binding FadR family transcriptional regulator